MAAVAATAVAAIAMMTIWAKAAVVAAPSIDNTNKIQTKSPETHQGFLLS